MDLETDQWVVQINEKLKSHESSSMEIQKWEKHCIYALPSCVADLKKKAYEPQTVSFGPYHHMKEHVKAMEEHKHRALIHFLRRCGKPLKFLIESMAKVEQGLGDCYKELDDQWKGKKEKEKENNDHSFLKMMIVDGCFMLEVLRSADRDNNNGGDYADNDPVFSGHGKLYVMPYIKRDMLMLENQIPMTVLEILMEFEGNNNTQNPEFLNELILKFLCPNIPIHRNFGKCLHVLDLFRKSLLQHEPTHPTIIPKKITSSKHHQEQDEIIIPSARELQETGIIFKPSKTHSLKDVSFHGGILRIPSIIIDDSTETTLLNLIAFERMHVGAGNEVSWFVFFMDNIIDNEVDVVILHQKGIIQNALGSDKAVAKLFNSLSKDLAVDREEGGLDIVQVSVCRYCKKPWNKWRANLIETYFRNPWAIVSLVAAIFLFVLTIIQTVYTIVPFYHEDNSNNPSPPAARAFIPRVPRPHL
ncbi:UPF0481 protein At3g47200-like [Neltuma alba]|uniref:UPF0481 protein At3g47200-like n=1 Tax=Neltuma alba TaxID=207710 RepID=UPI0010A41DBD|nr:UPF0481 protein At3g47200-like [Prosopis alba]